jgi:phosphoglycerate dehydrogenase-like enzyme
MPSVAYVTHQDSDVAAEVTRHAPASYRVTTHAMSLPDDEKTPIVAASDYLVLFPGRISEPVLRAGARLRLVQLVSAGYEHMPLALCRELGIPVANNGGTNSTDVAEHTLALILAQYRRMVELDRKMRADPTLDVPVARSTFTVDGKTVGIVGLGNIGAKVARLARAFGADVVYADEAPADATRDERLGVRRVDLGDLLGAADIVTLHVPLAPSTDGLIGGAELARMKPSAILVNTCRGRVVDEAALIDALRAGEIAGAALDVLEREPPAADNPLLRMDNVTLTPHTAGITFDTWARRGRFIFENIARVERGEAPLAVVSAG